MVTGFSADLLWKISVRTCGLSLRNAGRTGILQHPNSEQRGSKAARNFSTHTERLTSKLSGNRISGGKIFREAEHRDQRAVRYEIFLIPSTAKSSTAARSANSKARSCRIRPAGIESSPLRRRASM